MRKIVPILAGLIVVAAAYVVLRRGQAVPSQVAAPAPAAAQDPVALPGGLTPTPEQAHQIAGIRMRYMPIVSDLEGRLAAVDDLRPDALAERQFLRGKLAETKAEMQRALGLILTDEQKKSLGAARKPP